MVKLDETRCLVHGLDHLPPLPFIHLMEMYEQGAGCIHTEGKGVLVPCM